MSGTADTPNPAVSSTVRTITHYGLLVGVGMATALVVVAGPGNALVALVPVAVVGFLWLVTRLPLVASVSVLLTVLLAVDDSGDSFGQWRTPLAIVGDTLHFRLDSTLGLPGLAVTGMEIAAVALLTMWLWRKSTSREVSPGTVPAASIVVSVLAIYVVGVLVSEAVGLARGLPAAPWKLRNLLHPVLLTMLFLAAFRGPRDNRLIGRIIVFAACARAVLAIVVQREAIALTGGPYAHATSHGDSVLFAVAGFILIVEALERPGRRTILQLFLILPLIVVGAVQNDRRLVWVMIAMMLGATYLLSPMRGWKRTVTRALVVSIPVVVLYVAAGWNSQNRFFAPVKTFRGVSDTSTDRSAYWREVETWNIAVSMKESPFLGLGLGGAYTEHMGNDDVSEGFKEYREWPHNTVLGLLMLMGLIPFTAMWALIPLVVFLSVRSYRMAGRPEDRVAALACLGTAIACLVLAYGDTGAHFPQFKIFVALAVAVSARLAVATGAWPRRQTPVVE